MFKVGDKVRISQGATYSITQPNSTGTVLKVTPIYCLVVFDYLEGEGYGYTGESYQTDTFLIEKEWLEPYQPLTKEQQICNKVAQMYKRQQERYASLT